MRKKGALRTVVGVLLLILFAEVVYLKFIKDPVRVEDQIQSAAVTQDPTSAAQSPEAQENTDVPAEGDTDPTQQAEQPNGQENTAGENQSAAPGSEPADNKDKLPDIDIKSWEYLLVNPTHNVGEYTPEVVELEGQYLDSRIIEPMKEFVAAARAQGLSVYLSSGYRDYATQLYLFNRKVSQVGDADYAATIVAKPGTSEHQTGLACDITDQYYDPKTQDLENTELFKWMSAHCQEYGFIVRFPKGAEDITKIMYEPWHFRYVGVEAATYIMEHGITLEEFVELYGYDD